MINIEFKDRKKIYLWTSQFHRLKNAPASVSNSADAERKGIGLFCFMLLPLALRSWWQGRVSSIRSLITTAPKSWNMEKRSNGHIITFLTVLEFIYISRKFSHRTLVWRLRNSRARRCTPFCFSFYVPTRVILRKREVANDRIPR